MKEFGLGKRPDWPGKQNKSFRHLSAFVYAQGLVFWLCTRIYSEGISWYLPWWHPGLILFNPNWHQSQGPKPATGLIGLVGKTARLSLLFSPLKLFGGFLKKHDKRPLLLQSNGKRVWKGFCSNASFPVHCALACQILNLEIFTAGQTSRVYFATSSKMKWHKNIFSVNISYFI